MDRPMTKEESYVERRQLFKNIWETAMHIDEKDDIMSKPKVIKTLRLDEVDKCAGGKKKKQRIKNLRTVCNKILDFCDRQDADDLFYEQMTADGHEPPQHKPDPKPKKLKTVRTKRKVKKARSLHSPQRDVTQPRATTSDRNKVSRNTSPLQHVTVIKKSVIPVRSSKRRSTKSAKISNLVTGDSVVAPLRKTAKKRPVKRKRKSSNQVTNELKAIQVIEV